MISFPTGWMVILAASLIAAVTTVLLIRNRLRSADLSDLMDQPNERSLHDTPIPRIGGLLLFMGAATGFGLTALWQSMTGSGAPASLAPWPIAVLCLGAAGLVLLGWRDDRTPLPVMPRLAFHLLCAAAMAATAMQAGGIDGFAQDWYLGLAALAILTVGIAWFANLYNFMDGANGLAGLTALIGFATYVWMAPPGSPVGLLSAAIAGAVVGFLWFNWDPARLFMGDAGSIPLGFLAAGVGITGAAAGYWPWLAPVGIFLPFVFDATSTLALRAMRGENLSSPHRDHAYQQAVLAGWTHQQVSTVYGLLMGVCSLTSATFGYHNGSVSVALWAVIILIHASLGIAVRRQHKGRHRPPTD